MAVTTRLSKKSKFLTPCPYCGEERHFSTIAAHIAAMRRWHPLAPHRKHNRANHWGAAGKHDAGGSKMHR